MMSKEGLLAKEPVLWSSGLQFIDFGGFGGHKSWTYICVRGPSQVERWGVLACDEGVQVG